MPDLASISAPNAQGHNFIPFGPLSPGVDNLRELELFEQDSVTKAWTVVRDMTGWSSPRIRFFSSKLEPVSWGANHLDHTLLVDIAGEFDPDPTLGIIRYNVTARHVALLVQHSRRYGVSVDALNPDGVRVPLFRGSSYLVSGAQ